MLIPASYSELCPVSKFLTDRQWRGTVVSYFTSYADDLGSNAEIQ